MSVASNPAAGAAEAVSPILALAGSAVSALPAASAGSIGEWWWVAAGLGAGTLFFRIGFAEWRERASLPPTVERALEWLPAAALAAMVTPAFAPVGDIDRDWTLAATACVSALVGHRSRNLLLGVAAGVGTFWLLSG